MKNKYWLLITLMVFLNTSSAEKLFTGLTSKNSDQSANHNPDPGIKDSPDASRILQTLFINSTVIELSWNADPVKGMDYLIEQSLTERFSKTQSYSIKDNHLIIKDLTPNTIYFFRVKAANRVNADWSKAFAVKTTPPDKFPLTLRNGKLATSLGKPFLINGDTPWSLMVGPDRSGAELYLNNREQKGVNSIIINLIEHYFNGPEDAYGNLPFLVKGDFSTPNPAYFDHADFIIGKAREKGMAVFLFPAYLGSNDGAGHKEGWFTEVNANGPAKMYEYGKYLGGRYKDYKNIIWMMAGDCAPEGTIDEIRAMVRGIEETAGPQLFSVHNARYHSGITEYPDEKWLDMNTSYAECTKTPFHLLSDYKLHMPYFYVEGRYENEGGSQVCLRSQMYWAVLMGSNGSFFACTPVWGFDKEWEKFLDSQGAWDLQRAGEFFESRAWFNLLPDTAHSVLTSGFGNLTDGSYASAARMKDGSTVVVYTPDQRSLSVDMSKITGQRSHGWWYQPSSGEVFDAGVIQNTGSHNFIPPGADDWLLVLDNASLGLKAPGKLP